MDRLKSLCISDPVKCKQTRFFQLKVKIVRQVRKQKQTRLFRRNMFKTKGYKKMESQRMGQKCCAADQPKGSCCSVSVLDKSALKEGFIIRDKDVILIKDKRFISDMI